MKQQFQSRKWPASVLLLGTPSPGRRRMASRLVLRIQERYQRLTAGEQKLARLIMDGQDDTLTRSATELAEQAGVSKATAARFFQHLGYADFNEVKLQAR